MDRSKCPHYSERIKGCCSFRAPHVRCPCSAHPDLAGSPENNDIPVFTEQRREAVNSRILSGAEVPPESAKTPEELAHHVEAIICSFWNWPGNKESNAELVYSVALGALRKASSNQEKDLQKEIRNFFEFFLNGSTCADHLECREAAQEIMVRMDSSGFGKE